MIINQSQWSLGFKQDLNYLGVSQPPTSLSLYGLLLWLWCYGYKRGSLFIERPSISLPLNSTLYHYLQLRSIPDHELPDLINPIQPTQKKPTRPDLIYAWAGLGSNFLTRQKNRPGTGWIFWLEINPPDPTRILYTKKLGLTRPDPNLTWPDHVTGQARAKKFSPMVGSGRVRAEEKSVSFCLPNLINDQVYSEVYVTPYYKQIFDIFTTVFLSKVYLDGSCYMKVIFPSNLFSLR